MESIKIRIAAVEYYSFAATHYKAIFGYGPHEVPGSAGAKEKKKIIVKKPKRRVVDSDSDDDDEVVVPEVNNVLQVKGTLGSDEDAHSCEEISETLIGKMCLDMNKDFPLAFKLHHVQTAKTLFKRPHDLFEHIKTLVKHMT